MKTGPKLSMIAAISSNRALGKDNKLLWNLPKDLQRFRKITRNHPVIMGRKTFESIGKALPQRTNIVISRESSFTAQGCLIVHSLQEALKQASDQDNQEIFIIGGGEIYRQGIEQADKLYLTVVEGDYEADTFFPDYSRFSKVIYKKQEEENGIKFTFWELES